MDTTTLLVGFILFVLLLLRWRRMSRPGSLPLPPGPKGLPIIGNLLHAPVLMPWKTFYEWSKTYGEVLYLRIPNQEIVVLNSVHAAIDLLEKRSDIYSDRPSSVMSTLMSMDTLALPVMRYSSRWRSHRREFHQFFNQHEIKQYRPIQVHEARVFLQRVLDNPTQVNQYISLFAAAVVLKITYDMEITNMDDDYLQLANAVVEGGTESIIPGRFWVEFAPFLSGLPPWIPGARFKRFSESMNEKIMKMLNLPFSAVKQKILDGKACSSVAATMIQRILANPGDDQYEREMRARNVTGVAYATGADTSAAALQSFFIAMSLYPDVQAKAQNELDRVVGPARLPDFNDFDNLVYIQAVVLETMRWFPVSPVVIPHRVRRDDEYKGMLIPEGSTVMANAWAMLHNPEDYPDPERYNPDRFVKDGQLDTSVRNPLTIAFGFGRRICPGRWLGTSSLFIGIASTLHTMNIHPILGHDGRMFDPTDYVYPVITLYIEELPCMTTVRSTEAERLLREYA